MKNLAIISLAIFAASPALAQQGPQIDPLILNLQQDSQAYGSAGKHMFEDIDAIMKAYVALKAENEKLKSDAKSPTPAPTPSPKP
jgi:hypothetical protein